MGHRSKLGDEQCDRGDERDAQLEVTGKPCQDGDLLQRRPDASTPASNWEMPPRGP